MPSQRLIHHIDVPPQIRREIVELLHSSAYFPAIPLLRVSIALDIKLQSLSQGMKSSIVEECSPRRDISQRRRAKHPAEPMLIPPIEPHRPTQPHIVVARYVIGFQPPIPGHAQRLKLKIRENRMRPIRPTLAQMTARAIPPRRVVKQRKPSPLSLRQLNLPIHPMIEPAIEGIETRVFKLKPLNRRPYRRQSLLWIIQNMLSKYTLKFRRIRCFPHSCCNMLGIRIGHLVRIEQRKSSLSRRCIEPAIPT